MSTWTQIQGTFNSDIPSSTKDFLCHQKTKRQKLKCELIFLQRWFKFLSQTVKSYFLSSIDFFVTIMALLICSNETNITMFHDPNLRNEGTNLQEMEKMKAKIDPQTQHGSKRTSTHSWTNECVLGSEGRSSPFVERRWPLFSHHGPGTVDGTLVLARWRVHVSSFHHIDWGSDHRGDEAGAERRHKVARKSVCGKKDCDQNN